MRCAGRLTPYLSSTRIKPSLSKCQKKSTRFGLRAEAGNGSRWPGLSLSEVLPCYLRETAFLSSVKRKHTDKIVTLDAALAYRRAIRRDIVFTNGCFDILHEGHIHFLEAASEMAPCLVVAVNSDASVQALKGPKRPIHDQAARMSVIAALEAVDIVVLMEDVRCASLITSFVPMVWAKGGDYTLESLDAQERAAAEAVRTEIKIIPLIYGRSTTRTIEAIAAAH